MATSNQPEYYTPEESDMLWQSLSEVYTSSWFSFDDCDFASVNMDGEFTLDELKIIVAAMQAVVDKRDGTE